jgi:hypothetical protein
VEVVVTGGGVLMVVQVNVGINAMPRVPGIEWRFLDTALVGYLNKNKVQVI